MNIKYLRQICLYLVIIGLLFCVLSLIIPWGTIDAKFGSYTIGQVDFYNWGIHTTSTTVSNWSIIFNPDSFKLLFAANELNDFAIPIAFYFAVFFIVLMIIILGSISAYSFHLNKYRYNLTLMAGAFSIVTMFFFYIFINFGLFSAKSGLALKPYFTFSMGFYFMLISSILFFISYFVSKFSDNVTE